MKNLDGSILNQPSKGKSQRDSIKPRLSQLIPSGTAIVSENKTSTIYSILIKVETGITTDAKEPK
jgi:hypothetical protein